MLLKRLFSPNTQGQVNKEVPFLVSLFQLQIETFLVSTDDFIPSNCGRLGSVTIIFKATRPNIKTTLKKISSNQTIQRAQASCALKQTSLNYGKVEKCLYFPLSVCILKALPFSVTLQRYLTEKKMRLRSAGYVQAKGQIFFFFFFFRLSDPFFL